MSSNNDQPPRLSLAELRKRSERSQKELAKRLGTTQSGVSRIERQDDTKISTLLEYVSHLGGRLRLFVDHPDGNLELVVPALSPSEPKPPRSFRVIWQNDETRSFSEIGRLRFTGSAFVFEYTQDAVTVEGFVPFDEFPDLEQVYRSEELFAFFAKCLPQAADPSFSLVLEALGLSRRDATPADLLPFGAEEQSSVIHVSPEPVETPNGGLQCSFLVSGVRYADIESKGVVSEMIERLEKGERLSAAVDHTNPVNQKAIGLAVDGVRLGYVPDHLLDDVASFRRAGRRVDFRVERANGPDANWHLRLLVRMSASAASETKPRHSDER